MAVTENTTAKGIVMQFLHDWDLDALGDWAWNRYKETGSVPLVQLEMQDRPEYKARFAGRLALQAQGFQMDEATQIAWETAARQTMRQAGLPSQFYDSWADFQDMIAGGVSPAELGQRINDAYARVAQAPAEIRQTMGEYYGAYSDGALAALVLDANKAMPMIQQQIAAAETGGYLARQNIDIAKSMAESFAKAAGFDTAKIQQGAQLVGKMQAQGIFDPRFGEADTATVTTGLEAGFAGNEAAIRRVEQEQQARAASGQGAESYGRAGEGLGESRPY